MKTISTLRIYNTNNTSGYMWRKIFSNEKFSTKNIPYWNYKKERLKEAFPVLNDIDLVLYDGKEKEMMEILGYKLGKSKVEMCDIINTL